MGAIYMRVQPINENIWYWTYPSPPHTAKSIKFKQFWPIPTVLIFILAANLEDYVNLQKIIIAKPKGLETAA